MDELRARLLLRLRSRRARRLLGACVATLGISVVVVGAVVLMRWQASHAVQGDTRVVLNQAGDQLLRALHSRRGTLTLLRDTLDQAPNLHDTEQQALANSAVAHTRHLLGVGLIRSHASLVWWNTPASVSARTRARLDRMMAQHIRLRGRRQVPGTLSVDVERPLLVMLEPLRANANRSSSIVGVFDLQPLLADFFELILQQPYPIQVLDGDEVLYRSARWQIPGDEKRPLILEQPIRLDALSWTIQMQPGSTRAAKTISIFAVALIVFGVIVGLSLIGVMWLLILRTWILQRAVVRRTAALRRTLARVRQLAVTDELTGLYNRRYFLERWQWEYDRATRYQRELSCLMIDVDGFKQVNDFLGHDAGDLVLKHVAQELRAQLRQADILARFGGDEFIVALPETGLAQATAVAEKLRSVQIEGPWTTHPQVGPVRLSAGVGSLHGEQSPEQILQDADKALYESRRVLRRRSRSAGPLPEQVHAASAAL